MDNNELDEAWFENWQGQVLPRCEHCSEPSDDLQDYEDADKSVGYYDIVRLCKQCATALGARR